MNKIFALCLPAVFFLSSCGQKSFEIPSTNNNFEQGVTYNTKIDVVMMIDNSSSMLVHQTKLANDVPAMIDSLNASGLDWHVGVVTTDMSPSGSGGELVGTPTYVSNSTIDGVSVLQNKILAGEKGSNFERGFDSLKMALDLNNLNQHSPGFFRDDALMAIVFLTDENDSHSVTTPSQFISFMDALKPPFPSGEKSWIANLIGTLELSAECSANGFPTITYNFALVADASHGIKESICKASLSQAVQNIKVRILEFLREFHLDRKPILSSVKVYINGLEVTQSTTNGWEYIPDLNVIRFHGGAIPGANDKIRVDYDPAEAT